MDQLIVWTCFLCAVPSGGVQRTHTVATDGELSRRKNVKYRLAPGSTLSGFEGYARIHESSSGLGVLINTLYAIEPVSLVTFHFWSLVFGPSASKLHGLRIVAASSASSVWRPRDLAISSCASDERFAAKADSRAAAKAAVSCSPATVLAEFAAFLALGASEACQIAASAARSAIDAANQSMARTLVLELLRNLIWGRGEPGPRYGELQKREMAEKLLAV